MIKKLRNQIGLITLSLALLLPAHGFSQDGNPITPRAAVAKQALREVGLWGIGAQVEGQEPLPSDLWQDADGESIGLAFRKITPDQKFMPLQTLLQRVLFSGGTAPVADEFTSLERFKLAARIGPINSSVALLAQLPDNITDTYTALAIADTLLMANRIDEACAIINGLQTTNAGATLGKMRAVCYALNNEFSAAQLAIDTVPQTGQVDPVLQWMAKAIANLSAGAPVSNIVFRGEDGMQIAISRKLGLYPNREALDRTYGAALSAITGDISLARAAVMLRASSMSLITAQQYSEFAKDVVHVEVTTPVVSSSQAMPPVNGALVEPLSESKPPVVGRNIYDLLYNARSFNDWVGLSGRVKSQLRQVEGLNSAENGFLANSAIINGDTASALHFLGQTDPLPWQDLARSLMEGGENNLAIQRRLEAAASPKNTRPIAVSEALLAWSAGLRGRGLSELLNTNLPIGTMPPAGTMALLDMALARGSKAEVGLLAYLALQGMDPKTADVASVSRIVSALSHVGLEKEARELALYVIIARNIELAPPPRQIPSREQRPSTSTTRPPANTALPLARPQVPSNNNAPRPSASAPQSQTKKP
jgi:hypothetical protein